MMKPHDNPQDTSLIYDVVFESLNIYNNSDKLNYRPVNLLLQEGIQSKLSLEIKSPFVGSPTIEEDSAEDNESCSILSDYTKTVAEETLPSQDVANVSSRRNELTFFVVTNEEYSRDLIKCSGLTQNFTNNQEHAATPVKLSSFFKRSKSPSKNNVSETKTSRYGLCKGSKSEFENIKFEDLMNMIALGEKPFCASKNLVKTYSKEDISNERKSPKSLDPCSFNDVSKNYEGRKKAPENLLKPLRPNDISKICEKQNKLPQKINKPYVVCYTYESGTELQGSTNKFNDSEERFNDSEEQFNDSEESFDFKLELLNDPEKINAANTTVSATTITFQSQRRVSYDVSDQDGCCSVNCSKRKDFKGDKHVQTCCDSASCPLLRPTQYWQQSTNTSKRSFKHPSINQIGQLTHQASSTTPQFEERDKSVSKKRKYFNTFLKSPFGYSNKKKKRYFDCVLGKFVEYPANYSSAVDQCEQKCKGLERTLKDLQENGTNQASSSTPQFEERLMASSFLDNDSVSVPRNTSASNIIIYSEDYPSQTEPREKANTSYLIDEQPLRQGRDKSVYKTFFKKILKSLFADSNKNKKRYFDFLQGKFVEYPVNYSLAVGQFKQKCKGLDGTLKDLLEDRNLALQELILEMCDNDRNNCTCKINNIPPIQMEKNKRNTSSFQSKQNEIKIVGRKNRNSCGCCGPAIIFPPNYFGKIPEEPNPEPVKEESKSCSELVNTISLKLHRHKTELKDLKSLTKKYMNMLEDRYCRGRINYDICNSMCCENCARENRRNSDKHDEDYRKNSDNHEMNYEKLSENSESSSRGSHRESFENYMYNRKNSEKHDGDYRQDSDDHEMNSKRLSQNPDRDYRGSFENHDMYNRRNSEQNNGDYKENPDNHSMNYKKPSKNPERSSRESRRESFENYDRYKKENSEKKNEDNIENSDNHFMKYKKPSENPERSCRVMYDNYDRYNKEKKQDGDYRNNFENNKTDNGRKLQNCKTCYRRDFGNYDMYNGRNSEKHNENYRENPENRSRGIHIGSFENYEKQDGDYREKSDNHYMDYKRLSENPERSCRVIFDNYDMDNKVNSEKQVGHYRNHFENYETDNGRNLQNYKTCYRRNFGNYDMYNGRNSEKDNENYRENPNIDYTESFESHMCNRRNYEINTRTFVNPDRDYNRSFENCETYCRQKFDELEINFKRYPEIDDRNSRGNFESDNLYNRRNFEIRYGNFREYPDNYKMNNQRLSENPDKECRGNFENHELYNKENSKNNVVNHETDNKTNLQKCKQCNIRNSENNDKIGEKNLGKSNTNLSRNLKDDKNVQVDENIDLQNAVNDQGASEIIDSLTPPPKQSKSSKSWFFRRKKDAKTPEDSKKAVETVPKPKSSKDVRSLSSKEYNSKTIQQKKEMTVLWIT